jgi:flagellar motility protein MotE (MotC chaperone)
LPTPRTERTARAVATMAIAIIRTTKIKGEVSDTIRKAKMGPNNAAKIINFIKEKKSARILYSLSARIISET